MSKIEHKYDVGDVVLIPMKVSAVSVDDGNGFGYALTPVGGDMNAFIDEKDLIGYVFVRNEDYIYSEFKGEVPMRRIEKEPMQKFNIF